jgi:alpha-galactosidase
MITVISALCLAGMMNVSIVRRSIPLAVTMGKLWILFHDRDCAHEISDTKYCPKNYDYSKSKTAEKFNRMRDALQTQQRPILYSLCEWGRANVNTWAKNTGQSWRTTDDVENDWATVLKNLNQNTFALNSADFYGHPDPDMLEVGNNGLTEAQERTHFALWATMKSPLLIGTDLSKISSSSLDILKSKILIAFNQDDVYGKPAMPFRWGTNKDWTFDDSHPAEYWSGRFKDGIMILLFNNHDDARSMKFQWSEVPQVQQGKVYRLVDGWDESKDYGCYSAVGSLTVPKIEAHDTAVLVLKDNCPIIRTPRAWRRQFHKTGVEMTLRR